MKLNHSKQIGAVINNICILMMETLTIADKNYDKNYIGIGGSVEIMLKTKSSTIIIES